MSTSKGTVTLGDKTVYARLHTHQDPDPERSEYWGGPEGAGYIEGPMADIQHLANEKPSTVIINDENGVVLESLQEVQWKEAEVMWKQDDHIHGIVHLEWK